jgi:phosphatidylglycerol lysyltransferase
VSADLEKPETLAERLRAALPALVGFVLFGVSLLVLRRELHGVHWHELTEDVMAVPASRLVLAMGLTAANYLVLAGYDLLALAYVRRRLALARVVLCSFVAYAVANNVGFAMLSGASVRYRFYSRWGVGGLELSRIVAFYSATFWLGLLALGGASLLFVPPLGPGLPGRHVLVPVGLLLLGVSLGYVALASRRGEPVRVLGLELQPPGGRLALAQLAVSTCDWALAAAVFHALLPDGPGFVRVLGAFLAAQLLALASNVPGGVGVFEGLMVLLLRPDLAAGDVLPALVVYRVVYYLLPLTLALVCLVADELNMRRHQAARVGALLGQLTEELTPRALASFTFLAGVGLLFSGATPAAPGRLVWLDSFLPLGVIEISHFAGSLAGAGLLLVSQGLSRRLDAAYYLACGGVAAGIAASLLKGADVEEAVLLTLLLAVLSRSRPAFDRRAALFETRFSAGWVAAVAAALLASIWLWMFVYRHVEYSHELFWQFELEQEASRSLRAGVGAALAALFFAAASLLRPAPHEAPEPGESDLEDAARVIAAQTATQPYLAFLGDKALLYDDARRGFVMYGAQGRTFVALGDPVGPPDVAPELVRRFLEHVDDFDGVPVFYEVRKESLHLYADFGLTFVKVGEQACLDLPGFTLEGAVGKPRRQALRRLEKEGASFRIAPAAEVEALLPQLQAVSDDWLSERKAAEKGFSLGCFEPSYLTRFPVALVEREGRVVAFANLWPGPDRHELSVDLMRYHRDAPKGVMEALFMHVIAWGKAEGYRTFDLGMAPLSGFETSPVAPLWARLGAFLYQHGENLYNFQGLRGYKEKFDPVWEPRYLAYPGGLRLARVLADVAALVAGGYRKIFTK